jgi:hypothetical protein
MYSEFQANILYSPSVIEPEDQIRPFGLDMPEAILMELISQNTELRP